MLPPAAGGAPDSAVVLLHGYGSDGNDLISLSAYWRDLLPGALFLAPNAPEPAMMSAAGHQWFAIDWAGDRVASRQAGIAQARPVIVEFLAKLWRQTGIAPARTLLAGFSQGAMVALHAGLSLPAEQTLLGIIGFSGALLPPPGFGGPTLARPPVCLVHGDGDDVVDPRLSAEAYAVLSGAGFDVAYHVSRGAPHTIAPDGLVFATDFIAAQLRK